MGIYAELQADLAEALDTDLADAAMVLTYIEVTSGTYDPSTGAPSGTTNNYSTRGVVSVIGKQHADGEVLKVGDYAFLILDSEIDATPDVGQIIRYDSKDYIINNVYQDEVNATWVLTGRTT